MTGRSQDKLENAALIIAPFTIKIMHWPDTRITVWIKPFLPSLLLPSPGLFVVIL